MKKLRPILLAGGVGSRLWPLSTEDRPKQFIPIFKEFSLFDLTLQRLNKGQLFKKPLIVTSERYLEQVNESLLRTGIEAERIILEPESKNTFPAITMAIILALQKDKSENFIVTPSDHYISISDFHRCNYIFSIFCGPNIMYISGNRNLHSSHYCRIEFVRHIPNGKST